MLNAKHVIGNNPFGKENLLELFHRAEGLRRYYNTDNTATAIGGRYHLSRLLDGKTVALLFFEPSTRTYSSFYLAAKTLGAEVLTLNNIQATSVAKGETLEDTIRTLVSFPQLSAIVLRHPEKGAAAKAAGTIERLKTAGRIGRSIPVINAGDGPGWHPTQAYGDIYTLWRHGKLQEGRRLHGVISGDLTNARAIHSLVLELCVFQPKLYLVGPANNNIPYCVHKPAAVNGAELIKVSRFQDRMAENADFYYFIRLQEERLAKNTEEKKKQMRAMYKSGYGCSSRIRQLAGVDALFLHPGPMRNEMPEAAKWDSRLRYDEQIENGGWIRAALLEIMLNQEI